MSPDVFVESRMRGELARPVRRAAAARKPARESEPQAPRRRPLHRRRAREMAERIRRADSREDPRLIPSAGVLAAATLAAPRGIRGCTTRAAHRRYVPIVIAATITRRAAGRRRSAAEHAPGV